MTGAVVLLGMLPSGQGSEPPPPPSTGTGPASSGPASAGFSFGQAFAQAARQTGLPVPLLQAVAWQESGDNPQAVSSCGAVGVMQLMPGTAAELGVDPWQPDQNILGGARYLARQLHAFGGNLSLALAAYNAGPGAVAAYGDQVPPYAQTQQYVADVLALYRRLGGSS